MYKDMQITQINGKDETFMRRLMSAVLALLLALSLCACAAEEPQVIGTAPNEDDVTAASEVPTTEVTVPETTEPTVPETTAPVVYINPITGETMDGPWNTRTFMVSVGNTPDALPHHGFSQADIVFEMFVNDYCTRMLALFTDISQVPAVGSIRSLRYPFIDLAQSYDGIVCYAGGSNHVINDLYASGVDNIFVEGGGTGYYYRDKDRQNNGYYFEHTLFLKGAETVQYAAEDRGYTVTPNPDKTYDFHFAEDGTPVDGENAGYIRILLTLGRNVKDSNMRYDEELGKYVWSQYGENRIMVDGNNDETVAFENVFIIVTTVVNDADGYHIPDILGSGEGYYANGGKIVAVQWHRETDDDPFTFTLADGTPVVQGIGNSYIAVAPTQSTIIYQ